MNGNWLNALAVHGCLNLSEVLRSGTVAAMYEIRAVQTKQILRYHRNILETRWSLGASPTDLLITSD